MALNVKLLGYGSIASGETSLLVGYPATIKKSLLVRNVLLTNPGTSGQTSVDLYVKRNGAAPSYFVAKSVAIPFGGQAVIETPLTLLVESATNYEILYAVRTSGSDNISFVVNGFERDL